MSLLGDPTAAWPQLSRLLDEALSLPPPDRAGWLQSLPAEHAALKDTLAKLLEVRAGIETGDFLGTLPKLDGAPVSVADSPDIGAPQAGDEVGPWRLIRELGEGGMGSVWLAERADGQLKRQVALKLPRLTWARGLAERMARERDILATLEHPHIARLYDAGVDKLGRPWLALEYVQGRPIDTYAKDKALTVRQRVELLLQVCEAVAYAHSRLVIHRDLKPSNILVTDEGQARLLDFGIAKLVQGDRAAAEPTALTQLAGRALTLRYASPEQVAGAPLATASDVYSLGVVAFELLSGKSPYGEQAGRRDALQEAIERGALPLASAMAADGASHRVLRGDLDAVLARALGREPTQRYPTVDAFMQDLRHWLADRGVSARAVPWPARVLRWARRHPLPVGVAVALLLALLGGAYAQLAIVLTLALGSALALWQLNSARREAARAREALTRAEAVKEFLASVFVGARPRTGVGGVVTAADLLHGAWRRLGESVDVEPAVRAELGALVGASFNELGDPESARQVLWKVVDECDRILDGDHPVSLHARWRLGEALARRGEVAEASAVLAVLLQRLARLAPAHAVLHVAALRSAALAAGLAGRVEESIRLNEEAVNLAERDLGREHDEALSARVALANALCMQARFQEALSVSTPTFDAVRLRLQARRPHPLLSTVERVHADVLLRNGNAAAAAALLRQVLDDTRRLDVQDTDRVRATLAMLANCELGAGRLDDAAALMAEARALEEQAGDSPGIAQAVLYERQAAVALLRGDTMLADDAMARSHAIAQTLPAQNPAGRFGRELTRAAVLLEQGRIDEALAALEPPPGYRMLPTQEARRQRLLGIAYRLGGRLEESAAAIEGGLRALPLPPDSSSALERGLLYAEAALSAAARRDEAARQAHSEAALAAWQSAGFDHPALRARLPGMKAHTP